MLRAVKAHPGVFIGGAVTYALIVHFLLPRTSMGTALKDKLPS